MVTEKPNRRSGLIPLLTAAQLTLLATLSMPLEAQQPSTTGRVGGSALPAAVAEEVTRRLNDEATTVSEGDVVLEGGSNHPGNLAVLEGDLSLAGTVEGDLMVVNGNLDFRSGATVGGSVLVVGGRIANTAAGRIAGEIQSHSGEYVYERAPGGFRHLEVTQRATSPGRSPDRSDFLVTTGKSYNRVEGLPIAFGPRLQTAGSNPLRIQALGIYRTESGLTLDVERMGYYVRADQYLAGRREIRIGATLHSLVDPIEEWHLSDLETGLATFLLHRDYRDHYERTGWSVFANWEPFDSPVLLHVEGRWEKHGLRGAGSPWSLFRNADPWRHQPIVAEGRIGSVMASGEYDTRGSTWNPASGWLARVQVEHAFHTELQYPSTTMVTPDAAGGESLSQPSYGRFLTGTVDLRSYNRVDADSRLNFRFVGGGSLTGERLPPQRQHALGGEGSLPGYQLFSGDCGARDVPVMLAPVQSPTDAPLFYPHYGCDVFGLLQAEFRGKLAFRFRWDGGPWREGREEDTARDIGWDMSPDWSFFVDAGRGWTNHARRDEETMVNVGAGILLDRFGLYLAVPLTGGSGANVFVRLGPRF